MKFTQILTASCLATLLACPMVSSADSVQPGSSSIQQIAVTIDSPASEWSVPVNSFSGSSEQYGATHLNVISFPFNSENPAASAPFEVFMSIMTAAAVPTSTLQTGTTITEFSNGDRELTVALDMIGFSVDASTQNYVFELSPGSSLAVQKYVPALFSSRLQMLFEMDMRFTVNGQSVAPNELISAMRSPGAVLQNITIAPNSN